MRKMILVLGAMLLAMSFALSGVADEKGNHADTKTIEQKKAAIHKIMSQGQFKAHIQDDEKFCAAFLDDFTKQKGIEHIKPIVEVDDYNDPKLQDYFKQCSEKEFNKNSLIHHARTIEEQKEMDKVVREKEFELGRALTEEEKEVLLELRIDSYATKNFKLYKVDIDNNTKNGDEFVFYADGYKTAEDYYNSYGGYKIIDLEKCKIKSYFPTNDQYYFGTPEPVENYNGIFKYKGKYYMFDLYEDPTVKKRLLSLSRYFDDRYKDMTGNVCIHGMQNSK